jgi:elongation factor P
MISSNDFRTGASIMIDGSAYRVVEFLHVKPGKGSAFVRTKLKNVENGSVLEKTFRAGEMVPQAVVDKRAVQYTYAEGNENFVFMDMESFEEVRLNANQMEKPKYLKEGMEVQVLFLEVGGSRKVIGVEMPNTVVREVTETDPGLKGDTAQGGTKPATVEGGATVSVPLFINIGERIKIDTRTDTYLGRGE